MKLPTAPRALLCAFAFLLALLSASCVSPKTPAHYIGLAGNRALPVLVSIEEAEGNAAIAAHAGDEPAVDAALAAVEARWAPFWEAWKVFAVAQQSWALALERGDLPSQVQAAEATALAAFCAVRRALPSDTPTELLTVAEVACAP